MELRICIQQQRRRILRVSGSIQAEAIKQIIYGVLYAISSEIFPAKDRGTGNGLVSTAMRVFGVIVNIALSDII